MEKLHWWLVSFTFCYRGNTTSRHGNCMISNVQNIFTHDMQSNVLSTITQHSRDIEEPVILSVSYFGEMTKEQALGD